MTPGILRLVLLTAGHAVYVFNDQDALIDIQLVTLQNAGLRVDRTEVTATDWVFQVRRQLEERGVSIVDLREATAAVLPPQEG